MTPLLFADAAADDDDDDIALNSVAMVSQPIENSRSKDKPPAVVFIGRLSPECDNWYFLNMGSLLALLFLTARKK